MQGKMVDSESKYFCTRSHDVVVFQVQSEYP